MFCKNCGKELKKGAAFCHECGAKVEINETVQANPIESNVSQPTMANNSIVTSIKKISKEKLILIIAIPIWIIIIIACAMGGDSDVIESNSESGASFNCTMEDVIKRYNDNVEEHFVNDAGLSDNEFEKIRNQYKLKKSYFTEESDSKYFVSSSNNAYGITIQVDDEKNVYFVEMVWNNSLTDAESQAVMVLLRGLIMSVEPSKDYDEINQLIIDTDNSGGILQKDNVKHAAIYESNCTRFAAMANFDD